MVTLGYFERPYCELWTWYEGRMNDLMQVQSGRCAQAVIPPVIDNCISAFSSTGITTWASRNSIDKLKGSRSSAWSPSSIRDNNFDTAWHFNRGSCWLVTDLCFVGPWIACNLFSSGLALRSRLRSHWANASSFVFLCPCTWENTLQNVWPHWGKPPALIWASKQ